MLQPLHARAEPGGAAAPLQALDLAEVARQAVADSVPFAAAQGVEIALHAPAPVVVQGDAGALRILVRNLVDNAVRYAGRGAQVAVQVAAQAEAALVQVDDSGPGIPAAERERVFDRFFRRDGSAEGGSGLGLAIVRTIAQRHGGSVTLGEAPLGGLRAELRLPTSAAAIADVPPAAPAAATAAANARSSRAS